MADNGRVSWCEPFPVWWSQSHPWLLECDPETWQPVDPQPEWITSDAFPRMAIAKSNGKALLLADVECGGLTLGNYRVSGSQNPGGGRLDTLGCLLSARPSCSRPSRWRPKFMARLHSRMVAFELWHLETAALVHCYTSEGAALAFVRDVVVFGGRQAGREFQLFRVDAHGLSVVAEGDVLMRRALEDRVL